MDLRLDLARNGGARVVWPVAGLLALVALLVAGLWALSSIAVPFLLPIVLGYLLSPLVSRLVRHGFPKPLAALAVLGAVLGAVAALVWFGIPALVREAQSFAAWIPTMQEEARRLERELARVLPMVDWAAVQRDLVAAAEGIGRRVVSSIPDILANVFTVIYFCVVIPFLFFFFLKDGRDIVKRVIGLAPNRWFEAAAYMMHEIDRGLGRFLRGLLIENTLITLLLMGGLSWLGMKHAVLISLASGIVNCIPYMGPTIGYTLAGLTVLLDPGGNPPLLSVLGVISVVHLLDNVLFYPLLIGRSVGLHPINVIACLLVGGFFFGVVGMLLAVPFATSLAVVVATFTRALREYRV